MTTLKSILLGLITAFVAAVTPILTAIISLFIGFTFNFITGLVTDIHVNKKEFSIKKAFESITMLFFFFGLVYFLHSLLSGMGDRNIAQETTKYLTYIVSYWYIVNVLRNAKQIYPKSKAISFLYSVLTTEVFNWIKNMIGIRLKKIEDTDAANNDENQIKFPADRTETPA